MIDRNPYSPPEAGVKDIHNDEGVADVSRLPVSDGWKTKFRLISKAGGPQLKKLKDLSFGERFKITFNILAFLFGPFYYIAKGMWKRGLSLFAACVVVVVVLGLIFDALGYGRFGNSLGYGAAAMFAVRANIDHYKKWVLGDNGWW
jgi:Protein of unknown function (DUF2628)